MKRIDRRQFLKVLNFFYLSLVTTLFTSSRTKKCFGDYWRDNLNTNKDYKPIVLRMYNDKATHWDFKKGNYIEYIKNDVVAVLFEEGLKTFTNSCRIKESWLKVLTNYEPGDIITLKPNLNALQLGYNKNICTTPVVINTVIKSLVNSLKVQPNKIYVYDLCVNPKLIEKIIDYPVNCIGKYDNTICGKIQKRMNYGLGGFDKKAKIIMSTPINEDGKNIDCYMPKVLTETKHLINIPTVKSHQFLLLSGAMKNHFGTVRFSNGSQYPTILHNCINHAISDIYRNEHIKQKTRLIIVDGLFGAPLYGTKNYKGRLPVKWKTLGNNSLNSLFFSTDPVATESVLSDIIQKEQSYRKIASKSSEYLKLANKKGLGVVERSISQLYKRIEYIQKDVTT
ncbi:DUF362 domain-containing protein [Desulfosarcina ovata]|nr:DUF362 domain-containing protein [Desulfosarcina ovata]